MQTDEGDCNDAIVVETNEKKLMYMASLRQINAM